MKTSEFEAVLRSISKYEKKKDLNEEELVRSILMVTHHEEFITEIAGILREDSELYSAVGRWYL